MSINAEIPGLNDLIRAFLSTHPGVDGQAVEHEFVVNRGVCEYIFWSAWCHVSGV
jgi:hypothetical protein